MQYRIVVAMLLAAALSGCFDGGGIAGGGSSAGNSDTSQGASAATATTSPILLQSAPPSSVVVGSPYFFQPAVSSSSGSVTFAIEGMPSWASFDSNTGSLTGTPGAADAGVSDDITITATNGVSTGSVGPFNIRVISANGTSGGAGAPTLTGSPAAIAIAGQNYVFQPAASDVSGKPLTYAIANCPVWATFSTSTGMLSGTPGGAQIGTYSAIAISVSDGTATAALPPFSIAVNAAQPNMPVILGTPKGAVIAGQQYRFQPTASDADADTLTFSVRNAPGWASFNSATGELSGTPGTAQIGTYSNIVISVSNGTLSASLGAFSISVTATDVPVIAGSPATSLVVGKTYSFQPTASDPAGKSLTFSMANCPVWASFDTETGLLSGTPAAADVGSYPGLVISVSNGTSTASLPAFNLVVSKAPTPGSPTISGAPATSVVAGNRYAFTPTTTDPSGGVLTFSIENAPSWAAFDSATGELSGTPTAGDVGTYANITISVSDGKTKVSLPSFPISVTQSANASVTLSWTAPTENTNGTALTNLAGYVIYYGTTANQLTHAVKIANPGIASYVISDLSPGTWYFAMASYSTSDVQSANSTVASTIL